MRWPCYALALLSTGCAAILGADFDKTQRDDNTPASPGGAGSGSGIRPSDAGVADAAAPPDGSPCVPGTKLAAGVCLPDAWTAQPVPTTKALYGVAVGGSVAFAVGQGGVILRAPIAGTWTADDTPFATQNLRGDLNAVFARSDSKVYAAGDVDDGGVVISATGKTWTVAENDTVGFRGISGAGAATIAVGDEGNILELTSDSASWSTEQAVVAGPLHGAWAGSTSSFYAAGDNGMVVHWSRGAQYPVENTGVTATLFAVWGSGAHDLYAVGARGTILHSTGDRTWTAQDSNVAVDLHGVVGTSPNDLYAVGGGGTILHSTGDGAWTKQATGVTNALRAVAASSSGVYAVGDGGTILFHP